MSTTETESISDLLKLSKGQSEQLLNSFIQLWYENNITLEIKDDGSLSVFVFSSALDKIKVDDVERKNLSTMVSHIVDAAEIFLHSVKSKKTMEQDLKISSVDSEKLTIMWDRLEKEGILHEIDYKFHSSMPQIEIRSFGYDVRLLSPSHFDGDLYPICNVSFKTLQSGEKRPVSFELTKTEVKKLIKELQQMEKDIEGMNVYIKKVKINE